MAGLNLLHLNTGYATRKVHSHLIEHLSELGHQQTIYAPVRSMQEIGGNQHQAFSSISYHYPYILKPWHRILFRRKVKNSFQFLNENEDLTNYTLTHSHFLYSDGAVSLMIKKQYGIPYVVSVRNADYNAFMKLRPDLKWRRDQILKEAAAIVFLSPAYKEKVLKKLPDKLADDVLYKSIVQPNGLNEFWFETPLPNKSNNDKSKIRLLYVGEMKRNKNVFNLVKAAFSLSKEMDVELTLVGGGGNDERRINKLISQPGYSFVQRTGVIKDKVKLREIYRSHDVFVMPSRRETFGVVYIEALSQGTPVIHSKGQGIDGYFEDGIISCRVNPDNPTEIEKKILYLFNKSDNVKQKCRDEAKKFSWDNIANKYNQIYSNLSFKCVE